MAVLLALNPHVYLPKLCSFVKSVRKEKAVKDGPQVLVLNKWENGKIVYWGRESLGEKRILCEDVLGEEWGKGIGYH